MSRLDIMTPSHAQTVIDGLYRDVERRIAASPPGLCPVDLAKSFLDLCHAQTCGKCVPCRIGLGQLSELMEQVLEGEATMETISIIERVARVIVNSADCAIGRDAARLVLDGVQGFRDDYEEHILRHRCLGGMREPVPCVALCPAKAIAFPEKECGEWYLSDTRFGPFVHAQLYPGQENSGRLVTLLKQQARELAKRQELDLVICDGSPGVGCPVISSLSGANLAVAVVEPTPSGRHDFERVAALCDHFRIPVAVLINKADLNHEEVQAITRLADDKGYTVVGALPFDPAVTEAMIRRKALTETDSPLASTLSAIWGRIRELAYAPRKRG